MQFPFLDTHSRTTQHIARAYKEKKTLAAFPSIQRIHRAALNFVSSSFKVFPWKHIQYPFKQFSRKFDPSER